MTHQDSGFILDPVGLGDTLVLDAGQVMDKPERSGTPTALAPFNPRFTANLSKKGNPQPSEANGPSKK